jgi:hypothetical protein
MAHVINSGAGLELVAAVLAPVAVAVEDAPALNRTS